MKTSFPTRQILAGMRSDECPLFPARILGAEDEAAQPESNLFRFVVGEDTQRRPMSLADVTALGDVFSRELLLKGVNPLTLRALDQAIAALQSPALLVRRMFLVAEGAQFAAAGKAFELNARLVFTWQASTARPPDILLSTVSAPDDPSSLLQLIAWSEADKAFHFFERTGGAWAWAGNSFHALKAPSRGKGPFDSHINGGLVMKELKAPWTHWHSMNGSISRDVFGADGAFNRDPLFANLDGAELLEPIVRTGLRRWTRGRIEAQLANGVLRDLRDCVRQLLWCTSVNLVSSSDGFGSTEPQFDLPTSFFYDVDAIDAVMQQLDSAAEVIPAGRFSVDAELYRAAVTAADVAVVDDSPARHRISGDTHFAFLVPERAFEDLVVAGELITRGALSPRLAICLLLVDFTNPVFSPARAALLRHVPDQIAASHGGAALDQAFVAAVEATQPAASSPEAELLALWQRDDLVEHAGTLLAAFHAAVEAKLRTPAGIADVLALAESRRQVVRKLRTLAEFQSTMAQGAGPPEHLAMAPDGTVFTKASTDGEGEF